MPVVQLIYSSSVEAYLLWKCCSHIAPLLFPSLFHYCFSYAFLKPWIAWDILSMMLSVAGKLCNKCPKCPKQQNSSYSDYFNAISGLYRTAEPQEALWHYTTVQYFIKKGCTIRNMMIWVLSHIPGPWNYPFYIFVEGLLWVEWKF